MEFQNSVSVGQLRVGMYRERPGSDIVKQGNLKKLKVINKL